MDWIAKFTGIKTILGLLLTIVAVAAWAADTRYLLREEAAGIVRENKVEYLQQNLIDLQIEQGYVKDADRKEMLETLIKIKQTQLNAIMEK